MMENLESVTLCLSSGVLPNGSALKLRAPAHAAQGDADGQRLSNAAGAYAILPYLVALASFKRLLGDDVVVVCVGTDPKP